MRPPNLNAAWARAVAQELQRAGVTRAVICPGSRSAPLALALDEVFGPAAHTCLDERSGAFLALGSVKATGAPAVVLATSGSAGAHFFPAVLEAEAAHLPLVCLTADRPPELHGFGAPQTMDQRDLFGRHVRVFEDVPPCEPTDAAFAHVRAVVARAVGSCARAPRGPGHLNLPFREPLAPRAEPYPALGSLALDGRPGAPALALAAPRRELDGATLDALAAELLAEPRGIIVVGPRDGDDDLADAAGELSRRTGWPVLADGASGLRAAAAGTFVTHADLLLRHARTAAALRPTVLLRLGGGLTSKVVQQWVDGSGARTVVVSEQGTVFDPSHTAARAVEADAAWLCRELALRVARPAGPLRERALTLEARAAAALEGGLALAGLTEPVVAAVASRAVPAGGSIFVSSSMPVRDLDAFAGALPGVRVLANRGLNGIDGLVACAAGAALGARRPTLLLTGDVAFLHDLGGLVAAARLAADLVVLVIDNDGGGIFHFLPVHGATGRFDALFATPHGLDLAHAAAFAGATYHAPGDAADLAAAVRTGLAGGLHVVHVRTRRDGNVDAHRHLQAHVAAALDGA